MKAFMLTGLHQMEIHELADVKMERQDDVLLQMKRVGVCGSDIHYYETGRVGSQVVQFPYAVGHECSAVVKAVGPAVKKVKVGDEVAVDPAIICHDCDQCRAGRENTCRKLLFLGCPGQIPGCLSEYLVMPEDCLYPLSGKINLDQGALCEPLSIGYYAAVQGRLNKNSNIAILGSGPIGLCVMTSARYLGCGHVYVTDKLDYRVKLAAEKGANWAGNPDKEDIIAAILEQEPEGMDVVFECCGQQEAIDQAAELLKPGGTLVLVGIPREERISLSIDKMRRKELGLVNIRRQNRSVQPVIDMLISGKVDVDYMITHRFPFDKSKEAFDLVAAYADGVIKAVISF